MKLLENVMVYTDRNGKRRTVDIQKETNELMLIIYRRHPQNFSEPTLDEKVDYLFDLADSNGTPKEYREICEWINKQDMEGEGKEIAFHYNMQSVDRLTGGKELAKAKIRGALELEMKK